MIKVHFLKIDRLMIEPLNDNIDQILEIFNQNNIKYYKIKWKKSERISILPKDNMKNCQKKIIDFYQNKNFINNDENLLIISGFKLNNTLFFDIYDKINKKTNTLSSDQLKILYPLLLLDFYEKHVEF